jgi:hypothetical protein
MKPEESKPGGPPEIKAIILDEYTIKEIRRGVYTGYAASGSYRLARKLRWKFFFAWFDLWVGGYVDMKKKILYVCPLPCCVFQFWFEQVAVATGDQHEDYHTNLMGSEMYEESHRQAVEAEQKEREKPGVYDYVYYCSLKFVKDDDNPYGEEGYWAYPYEGQFPVGYVSWHDTEKRWVFTPSENTHLDVPNMKDISDFLGKLKHREG